MRSLFQPAEKSQYVPVAPPAEAPVETLQESPTEASDTRVKVAITGQSAKQKRVKKSLTPQEQLVRRRRNALIMLTASIVIGGRWFAANLAPTYPTGKGVYPPNAAPKWGKMKQPNAATFYMAAADAFDLEAINGSVRGIKFGTSDWMDQPIAVQKPAVAIAQPAFALLRQGMKYPYVEDYQTNYFKSTPITAKGIARPVANFIVQREMTRLLAAEANVRASEGNQVGAIESSLDAVRLGVDQAKGHSLIDGMIGVLMQNIGAKEALKHVAGLNAEEARASAGRLENILTTEPTLAQVMTRERDMVYETIRDVYNKGSISEFDALESGLSETYLKRAGNRIAYGAVLMYYTKQGLVNDYASYMDTILARLKMPYYQAKQLPSLAEPSNPFVQIAVPNYTRAFQTATRTSAMNRILLGRLAVQAYQREHRGRLPISLSELSTEGNTYLSAIPTDPFSLSGKEALRYDPRTGKVYSVGENGIDDGNTGDDALEVDKR